MELGRGSTADCLNKAADILSRVITGGDVFFLSELAGEVPLSGALGSWRLSSRPVLKSLYVMVLSFASAGPATAKGPVEVEGGANESQVGERLREVAQR